jgi:hypothetical protein
VILALFACAKPDHREPAEEALDPESGWWQVTLDDTWGGDCALEDPSSDWSEPERWYLELHASGKIIFHIPEQIVVSCAYASPDFECDIPTDSYAYDPLLDAVETNTRTGQGDCSAAAATPRARIFFDGRGRPGSRLLSALV